jgi:hypothetical protein
MGLSASRYMQVCKPLIFLCRRKRWIRKNRLVTPTAVEIYVTRGMMVIGTLGIASRGKSMGTEGTIGTGHGVPAQDRAVCLGCLGAAHLAAGWRAKCLLRHKEKPEPRAFSRALGRPWPRKPVRAGAPEGAAPTSASARAPSGDRLTGVAGSMIKAPRVFPEPSVGFP